MSSYRPERLDLMGKGAQWLRWFMFQNEEFLKDNKVKIHALGLHGLDGDRQLSICLVNVKFLVKIKLHYH